MFCMWLNVFSSLSNLSFPLTHYLVLHYFWELLYWYIFALWGSSFFKVQWYRLNLECKLSHFCRKEKTLCIRNAEEANTWEGKHVWLIVRQLPMKAGLWDTPFAFRNFTEAISIITDNGLPLLTENNFQTPPPPPPLLFGPSVYWYLELESTVIQYILAIFCFHKKDS